MRDQNKQEDHVWNGREIGWHRFRVREVDAFRHRMENESEQDEGHVDRHACKHSQDDRDEVKTDRGEGVGGGEQGGPDDGGAISS